MNRAVLILALVLLPVTAARGQVAAPGLLPWANPATLSWEFSTLASSTLLAVEQRARRNASIAADREGSGEGALVRIRYPGRSIAVGSYFLDAGVELGDGSVGVTQQSLRTFGLGISTIVEGNVALGAALEGIEEREATAASDRELGTLAALLGASLRFGEIFHLATIHGRRRLVSNITEKDGQERPMSRVGAGILLVDSSMLLHAEVSREESPPFRDVAFEALPGLTFEVLDTRSQTAIVELVWRGLLVAYSTVSTETLGQPLRSESVRTQSASLGVVQPKGLSVTLTWRLEETADRVKKTDEELTVLALGFHWRFK